MTTTTTPQPIGVIRWENPPTTNRTTNGPTTDHRWTPLANQLRNRPGRWAVIWDGPRGTATSLAHRIRHGAIGAFAPAGDYDAVTRHHPDGVAVYARYLGDGTA